MTKRVRRAVKLSVLVVLTIFLISACSGLSQNTPSRRVQSPAADCRVIQHAMGETCVPANPQRVIVLNTPTLGNVLALGVKPIGVATYLTDKGIQFPSYLEDKVGGIEFVGNEYEPSLEKILLLKPDLIIGFTDLGQVYDKLEQIAPTVLFDWVGFPSWQEHFNFVAQVLDKTKEAQQLWDDYHRRLEDFRVAMGERLKQIEASYAFLCCNEIVINIDVKNSFSGSILNDAGLRRPPAQDVTIKGGVFQVSEERLTNLDSDVLFISTTAEDDERRLEKLKQKPLWTQLKAVQQDRVYLVDGPVWRGGNILATDGVIDDLFKYLVKGRQSSAVSPLKNRESS